MKDILQTSGTEIASTLKERTAESVQAAAGDGYQALHINQARAAKFERLSADVPTGIKVRPHKDDGGIAAGRQLLESLHTIDRSRWRSKNISPAHAFEPRYDDSKGTITLQFVPGSEDLHEDLDTHIRDKYPGAITTPTDSPFLDLSPGRKVAGANQQLDRYTLWLIRNCDLEGFNRNPYGSITSEIASAARRTSANVDIAVQVLFRPIEKPWKTGVDDGKAVADIVYELNQPNRHERRNRLLPWKKEVFETDPSKKERKAADVMDDLYGERAWSLNVRVFASADTAEAATLAVQKVAEKFQNYYESSTGQRFVPQPLRGKTLRTELARAVSREWVDWGMVFSEAETAGLVNCMDDQINTQEFKWALANPGEGLPPGTASYDFDAAGVADASRAEKFLTMLDHPEHGDDAYWLGWGKAGGKEAGIFTEFLNAHSQTTGGTRMGKTNMERVKIRQAMERGDGLLAILIGKGEKEREEEDDEESLADDEEVIAEIPEDRRDDLVFIDSGDEFDKMVRFNLLQIPDNLEVGTKRHTSFMESMCDQFCAAFAQAGGDNELYPLMRGLTRTTVRGMAMSGKVCTPLDLAAAASSQENMGIFSQWMDEERIYYIRETVKRFKEKEDKDFEPIARRMDEIVHNATLRKLLSAREPTVSIQDLVDDDAIVVMRIDPAMSDTERQFFTNPVVRRFAHARTMTSSDNAFHFFWDEADKAATEHSNLGQLLSIMGGYDTYFHLTYQAPSHQLPPDLWEASQSQIDNTQSFRTRGPDADKIAKLHTIDAHDLTHLPRYTFYMTTDTKDGDSTDSLMVQAARPLRDMREEVKGIDPLTQEDVHELKASALDATGEVPESEEERIKQSHFFDDSMIDDVDDEDEEEDVEPRALDRAAVIQAVYDEAYLESGDGYDPVPMKDAEDRIRRYLERIDSAFVPDTASQYTALLGYIPIERLERFEEGDGTFYLRCTEDGKMRFTSPAVIAEEDDVNENVGGPPHAAIMREGYDQWLDLDLGMQIHIQDGGNLPDATLTPQAEELERIQSDEEIDEIERAELLLEFRENRKRLDRISNGRPVALEAEHYTGSSAPAQTLTNLAAALEAGRRCILLARPKTATAIWKKINQEPYMMREFDEDGAARLYNKNRDLRVGEDEEKVYRPSGCGQSVWLYHDDGTYELRDSEGKTRATFDDPAEITSDLDAYPMRKSELKNPDDWSAIKAPFVPEVEFADVEAGGPLPAEKYDVGDVRSAEEPLRFVTGPAEDDRQDVAALGDGRCACDEEPDLGTEIEPERREEPTPPKDSDESENESRPSAPSFSTE